MKLLTAVAWASIAISTPAYAALFVAGDSNILGVQGQFGFNGETFTANQQFILNIAAGGGVTFQNSSLTNLGDQDSALTNFLLAQGLPLMRYVGPNATLTADDFAGKSLFIGFAPNNSYTSGELTLMSNFLAGGGNILLTGENQANFSGLNARINTALASLNSQMRLGEASIGAGVVETASVVSNASVVANTTGFRYVYTTVVTGGIALFQTQGGEGAVLAAEGITLPPVTPGVPEPASWAMLIAGFGLTGAAMRRRRTINA
jgi:hypothetical protein